MSDAEAWNEVFRRLDFLTDQLAKTVQDVGELAGRPHPAAVNVTVRAIGSDPYGMLRVEFPDGRLAPLDGVKIWAIPEEE